MATTQPNGVVISVDRKQIVVTTVLVTASAVATVSLIRVGANLISPSLRKVNNKLIQMANQ